MDDKVFDSFVDSFRIDYELLKAKYEKLLKEIGEPK